MTVLPDTSQDFFTSAPSLTHTHILTQTHTHWRVIRVSDRVQAKPFLFLPSSLPPYHCLPLSSTVTPRCSGPVTGAPEGQKPVGQWQLTVDSLSQRHRHTQIHTTPMSFPPPLCCHYFSFFSSASFAFSLSLCLCLFVFSTSSLFLWLKLLIQAVPLELAVPVNSQLLSKPRAGRLHWGAKRFWPPLKPWRIGRMQSCCVGGLMCWSPAGGLEAWRTAGSDMWIY